MNKIVIALEESRNSKTGPVSVTYAPIQSCPSTCALMNKGCYAQGGNTGIHLARINKNTAHAKRNRPIDIAREEYKAISLLSGKKPLRLHIVGDCKTPRAARILSHAAEQYKAKDNQPVWTYTHAWETIPRDSWGGISVLASCETMAECKRAINRGYAPSIIRLKEFTKPFKYEGFTMLACSELTHGVKCVNCTICFDADRLRDNNMAVCFFPHGNRSLMAKAVIRQKWQEQDK
jgi:hypothetical protein